MGAADPPAAHMDGAGLHPVRGQLFHEVTHGGYICQGIQGANLVEVDLRKRHSVHLTFRIGDHTVHLAYLVGCPLGQIEMGNHLVNGGKGAVSVVIIVVVTILALFFTAHQHPHPGTGDAAFLGGFQFVPDTGNADAVQLLDNILPVGKQFQQGGGEHIPRRAHAAVQIQ